MRVRNWIVTFESEKWHGMSDSTVHVRAETADEAMFLAEPYIQKALEDAGYEDDYGTITNVELA